MTWDYKFKFKVNPDAPRFNLNFTRGYIGAVKIVGLPVMGAITQDQINAAVNAYIADHPGALIGLTEDVKQALLQIAEKIAYIDEHGQDYYDALHDALYPQTLVSITATYTPSGTIYTTDTLDDLKPDLIVTGNWSDGTTTTIPETDYTLSGTLTAGTSTITVTYEGFTDTFTVSVVAGYVTDGLVAYWDGIDNTGTSHDAAATTWVDKVQGFTFSFQNSNGRAWNANNLQLSSGHRGLKTASRLWSTYEDCTIEYVIEPAAVASKVVGMFDPNSSASTMPSGTNARQLVVYNDNTVGFFATTHTTYSLPAGVSDITQLKKVVGIYHNYTISDAYINNASVSLSGNTHSFGQFGPNNFRLGEWSNVSGSNTAPFYGKIYAVRYYNRALTAEEITQNYNFDVSYYGLGS